MSQNSEPIKRSNLYHLEPIGIGTAYVEGLSSYIGRLANAHCVSARVLVTKFFNLRLEGYLSTLNGNRSLTPDFITQIEQQTMITGLSRTTMLAWVHILAQYDLFKKFRTWCPLCYSDWSNAHQPIYDPLIWSLGVISHCPIHHQPLRDICPNPNCHKQIRKYDTPLPGTAHIATNGLVQMNT